MTKQEKYDKLYMDIASRCAEMSYAIRHKVGCLIVRDGQILSQGWNGTAAGVSNDCEKLVDGVLVTLNTVFHAEENSLAKISKSTLSSSGATAYITLQPCIHCAKLLASSGIIRVVYKEKYRSQEGIDFLKSLNIEIGFTNET